MGRATRSLLVLALAICGAWTVPAGAVVGGRLASEPYPWMASLQHEGEHHCGATLVRPQWVLTAAHCLDDVNPVLDPPQEIRRADLAVVLGRTDLGTSDGETFGVAESIVHEDYATDPVGGHDVALLRLDRPSAAAPLPLVTLEQRDLWAPGRPARGPCCPRGPRVIGWGTSVSLVGPTVDKQLKTADDLREVDVEMISDEECELSYTGQGFDPKTQVCAGRRIVGLADSCQGDSGGPLAVRDGEGAWTQVGVVSQGRECGLPLFYGMYARIGDDPLRDWLRRRLADGGAPAGRSDVRLRFSRRLGRDRGALLLRLRASAPVTNLRATIKRRGEVVGRGRRSSLRRRGALRIPVDSARPGRMRARVTAVDADGLRVQRAGRVRLRR